MSGTHTCRMPIISLVAWKERGPSGFIFVRVPNERGRYLRTDPCVALVPCPFCNSTIGEPCRSRSMGGYVGGTHHHRRGSVRTEGKRFDFAADVTDDSDGANVSIREKES